MDRPKNTSSKIILIIIGVAVLVMGIFLFFVPPAVFPDPGMGFQVLRSMRLGGGFNNFVGPDQSDISQNYTEFLTWWSPGQYLVPYLFKLIANLNTGQAIAVTVTICQLLGLAGFYSFFKKIGFAPFLSAISILFIVCQQAFVVPYVYYSGGELLIFAFEGWFLFGCLSLNKPGLKLVLFVFFAGLVGFFLKSSFLWIYFAGLCYLWISISGNQLGIWKWIIKGLWIGIPAAASLALIYIFYISKGLSPASTSHGFKLTAETFSFPLASPILSGFSVDDLLNGLIYHTGKHVFNTEWSLIILLLLALSSLLLIFSIIRYVPNNSYKLVVIIFYFIAILFFGFSYLHQFNISFEARHFRIIGILVAPGVIYLASRFKLVYQLLVSLIFIGLGLASIRYVVIGYQTNKYSSAKGVSGISQPNIDQPSLNYVMKLDRENRNAIFVFICDDIGLEILHNRIITLQPIGPDLKIDMDDYVYQGHAGPLFIVLPANYAGPKEKMIMKSLPGYKGFTLSILSNNYTLYAAD